MLSHLSHACYMIALIITATPPDRHEGRVVDNRQELFDDHKEKIVSAVFDFWSY
jgi:hypothetical protein